MEPIPVDNVPEAIAITPNGTTAYVATSPHSSGSNGTVVSIDIATNRRGRAIAVGEGPTALAITPNGTTLYVADEFGEITPIDIATGKAGKSIPLKGSPPRARSPSRVTAPAV